VERIGSAHQHIDLHQHIEGEVLGEPADAVVSLRILFDDVSLDFEQGC
jgi:hypothetical protein